MPLNESTSSVTNIRKRQLVIDHEQSKSPMGVVFSEFEL